MSSSWVPDRPSADRSSADRASVRRSGWVSPSSDISLRNHAKWLSIFNKVVVRFLAQVDTGGEAQMVDLAASAIEGLLVQNGSDEFRRFDVVDRIIKVLLPSTDQWFSPYYTPTAYGTYVVKRSQLRQLLTLRPIRKFTKGLYRIFPHGADKESDTEFEILLWRRGLSSAPPFQASSDPNPPDGRYGTPKSDRSDTRGPSVPAKRQADVLSNDPSKRQVIQDGPLLRPVTSKGSTPSVCDSKTAQASDGGANVQSIIAHFTNVIANQQKENSKLLQRITDLEQKLAAKEEAHAALKSVAFRFGRGDEIQKGIDERQVFLREKELFALEKQELCHQRAGMALHLQSLIKELEGKKAILERRETDTAAANSNVEEGEVKG